MATTIDCFWLEPTLKAEEFLRRYARGGCTPVGIHNASVQIAVVEHDEAQSTGDNYRRDDPRWPKECSCGYTFVETDNWQHGFERLYQRSDTSELITLRTAPIGAMWNAHWLKGVKGFDRAGDGMVVTVKTPGGDWVIDGPSSNGDGWKRAGLVPKITATPSILTGSYHGWLRDGQLIEC